MNSLLLLIVVLAVSISVSGVDIKYTPYGDEDFTDVLEAEADKHHIWQIPQFDGSFKSMTEQEAKELTLLSEIPKRIKNMVSHFRNKRRKIRFFLYTQKNVVNWQEIDMDRPETLHRSFFNSSHVTRIYTHGWLNGVHVIQSQEMIDSHLMNGRKEDYNIIIVDWSLWSMTYNYYLAHLRTRKVGLKIANFIDWLHSESGLDFETTHVIGYSMGGHVAGITGKLVTKGRINTIIGLDPAMPLFWLKNPENRIADTDAEYVETIQTNGGMEGFQFPLGQATFYPNGGSRQPGCKNDFFGACAHARSVTLFAEAVAKGKDNSFDSLKCEDWQEMKDRKCSEDAQGVKIGDPGNFGRAKGVYFLNTEGEAPYGIGKF
ncbi:hypothetical protein ACFFRR_004800 [Megaselia abdita]